MQEEQIPQWLKEVLKEGFKPNKIYKDFDKSLFGFVEQGSKTDIKFPVKKLFTIEGIPGSGKTSIIKKINNKITTIDQILPKEPKFDQAMNQKFYFKSDVLKTANCLNSNTINCLLDRYYVSTLAFYWSYDKIFKTNQYNKAINWYYESIKLGKLIKPFTVFYINTPMDIAFKRKDRIPSDSFDNLWLNREFLLYFEKYHKYFYQKIENKTKVIYISGKKPISYLIKEIEGYIYE